MTRTKKARGVPAPPRPDRYRGFTRVVLALLATAGVLSGVAWLGTAARRGLADKDRYSVAFRDIECEPPPGLDRPTFLMEVRYVSGFPASFSFLDPELAPKLRNAFAMHPWVAAAEEVSVREPGSVTIGLTFRRPVLSVRTEGGQRLVDKAGVLLPVMENPPLLPELRAPVPMPGSPAGQPWPDERVKRAVQLAESFHPLILEATEAGWRLTLGDGTTVSLQR